MNFSPPNRAEGLRRAVVRLNRRLRAAGTDQTLSANKLSVLGFLYTNPSSSAGELAAAERLQPQSLTRLLSELEGDGLITRVKSKADRRQTLLKITSRGKEILIAEMRDRDEWLMEAISDLSEVEQHLLPVIGKVLDHLAEHQNAPDGRSIGGNDSEL